MMDGKKDSGGQKGVLVEFQLGSPYGGSNGGEDPSPAFPPLPPPPAASSLRRQREKKGGRQSSMTNVVEETEEGEQEQGEEGGSGEEGEYKSRDGEKHSQNGTQGSKTKRKKPTSPSGGTVHLANHYYHSNNNDKQQTKEDNNKSTREFEAHQQTVRKLAQQGRSPVHWDKNCVPETVSYLRKHHINELMDCLVEGLANEKPLDPLLYIEESMEVLRREKHRVAGDIKSVMTEGDVYLESDKIPQEFDEKQLHEISQRQMFLLANMERQATVDELGKAMFTRKHEGYNPNINHNHPMLNHHGDVDAVHRLRNELSKPHVPLVTYSKPPLRILDASKALNIRSLPSLRQKKQSKITSKDEVDSLNRVVSRLEEESTNTDDGENGNSESINETLRNRRISAHSVIDLASYDSLVAKGRISGTKMGGFFTSTNESEEQEISKSKTSSLLDECVRLVCEAIDFGTLYTAVKSCVVGLSACDRVEVFKLYPNRWTKMAQELKLKEVYDYRKLHYIIQKKATEDRPKLFKLTTTGDEISVPEGGLVNDCLKTKQMIVFNSDPSRSPDYRKDVDDTGANPLACVVYIPILGTTTVTDENGSTKKEEISLGVLQVAREKPHVSPFLQQTIIDLCTIAKTIGTAYHKVYMLELERLKQSILIERILRREKLILFLQDLNMLRTCEEVCHAIVHYITKDANVSQECLIFCRDFEQPEFFQYVLSTSDACDHVNVSKYVLVDELPFAKHVITTGEIINIADSENHTHGKLLDASMLTLRQSHRPSVLMSDNSDWLPSRKASNIPKYHSTAKLSQSISKDASLLGINKQRKASTGPIRSTLAAPLCDPEGNVVGVFQIGKSGDKHEIDPENTGAGYSKFLEMFIHKFIRLSGLSIVNVQKNEYQQKLQMENNVLLELSREIFLEVDQEKLSIIIMQHLKKLVKADRCALFIVDHDSKELWSAVFTEDDEDDGEGEEAKKGNAGTPDVKAANEEKGKTKVIRFPMDRGIAGSVCESGKLVNIEDAYSDPRFNKEVDRTTGYVTKTILCTPIKKDNKVLAVAQLVNKENGRFNKHDEELLDAFADLCGMSLYNAQLMQDIRKAEKRTQVAMEMISYHSQCKEEDVRKFDWESIKNFTAPSLKNLSSFDYTVRAFEGFESVNIVLGIFAHFDLIHMFKLDQDILARFVVTISKNYRDVQYHNWHHALAVTHACYYLSKRINFDDYMTEDEKLALIVACLCHDVDHRGTNNRYMVATESALADLYNCRSVMEQHHFNHTIFVLQSKGHNIFSHLSPTYYSSILRHLNKLILATDLANHFGNLKEFSLFAEKKKMFDRNNQTHRYCVLSMLITCCDLFENVKPWSQAFLVAKIIMSEFTNQSLQEKEQGLDPFLTPENSELPKLQTGFIANIARPTFAALAKMFPQTNHLLEQLDMNNSRWMAYSTSGMNK
eukprot:Nk52_evm4s578 gene=Nk52_evmTU4s578